MSQKAGQEKISEFGISRKTKEGLVNVLYLFQVIY